MGGFVSSIFDLASGNPTEDEQKQLGSLGTGQIGTGESLVAPAAKYDENILSGDPSLIAQSLTPEISAGQGQVEQQRLSGAEFGNRGGGTNAATQNAENAERGNIINLVGGLQKSTADAAGNLGANLESLGSGNVKTEADLAAANRQREVGDVGGIAQGGAEIISGILGAGGAETAPTTAAPDLLSMASPEDTELESINARGIS